MDRCPREMPSRELTNVEVKCPSCGREIELFSDEVETRCPCGAVVRREGTEPEQTPPPDAP
ncbi:MAG: hypothetical protein WBF17_07945 [Phycisphaerae bacterium]